MPKPIETAPLREALRDLADYAHITGKPGSAGVIRLAMTYIDELETKLELADARITALHAELERLSR